MDTRRLALALLGLLLIGAGLIWLFAHPLTFDAVQTVPVQLTVPAGPP